MSEGGESHLPTSSRRVGSLTQTQRYTQIADRLLGSIEILSELMESQQWNLLKASPYVITLNSSTF